MILFIIGDGMKKGFTLIEVLAVLVILAVIGMIAVPAVTKIINESRQKSYDSHVELIIENAKRWATDNNHLLPDDDSVYKLPVKTLIDEKYLNNIKDGNLKNPLDSSKPMDGCVYINYNEDYNQYLYEYREDC